MSFKRLISIIAFALLFQAETASAWDGDALGKIQQVDVTNSGNYPLRIFLVGSPPLCGNAKYVGVLR